MNKETNKIAVEIAKEYFTITNRHSTSGVFTMTIAQARHLLDAGFTKEEIIIGIQHCTNNPPKNGFNSLGWLQYDLDRILKKVKAQQVKEQQQIHNKINEILREDRKDEEREYRRQSEKERTTEYNFDFFEER